MDKGSGSDIFPDPDLGDPKRPDPDPQHCRIDNTIFEGIFAVFTNKYSSVNRNDVTGC